MISKCITHTHLLISRYFFLYDTQFHIIYHETTPMEGNHHQKTRSRNTSSPHRLIICSSMAACCLILSCTSTTPTATTLLVDNIYRGTSRASSVSCRDSLTSSRSNSTNSSRSSVSSARTSSSDSSERRRFHNNTTRTKTPLASKAVMAQLYGSSQRWQHIMPVPAAVLKREDSRRKSGGILVEEGLISSRKHVEKGKRDRAGIWRRFFRSFLVACRECHAMEPSARDIDMLQENIKS
ncbi:membrane-associated kinase regulator [Salix suchowensis]|nr:membrane-associated kinase regulator [Salix suchowensis]